MVGDMAGIRQPAIRLSLWLMVVIVCASSSSASASSAVDCSQSDAALSHRRAICCASIVGRDCQWCRPPQNLSKHVHQDWPNQVTYFRRILAALLDAGTCLNTAYAAETVNWLETVQANMSLGEKCTRARARAFRMLGPRPDVGTALPRCITLSGTRGGR